MKKHLYYWCGVTAKLVVIKPSWNDAWTPQLGITGSFIPVLSILLTLCECGIAQSQWSAPGEDIKYSVYIIWLKFTCSFFDRHYSLLSCKRSKNGQNKIVILAFKVCWLIHNFSSRNEWHARKHSNLKIVYSELHYFFSSLYPANVN